MIVEVRTLGQVSYTFTFPDSGAHITEGVLYISRQGEKGRFTAFPLRNLLSWDVIPDEPLPTEIPNHFVPNPPPDSGPNFCPSRSRLGDYCELSVGHTNAHSCGLQRVWL